MKKSVLDPAQEEILRKLVIDQTHPGPVLHDFEAALDFVGEKGVRASGIHFLLPAEVFSVLDERLTRRVTLASKQPKLRDYPYLQGLHLLLRASGLVRIEGRAHAARLFVDSAALARWNDLNPVERYFGLLEAWLVMAQPEMVGERVRFHEWFLYDCLRVWGFLLHRGRFAGIHGGYHVALMDLFGLVQLPAPEPHASWPGEVRPTPFGRAVFRLLENVDPSAYALLHDLHTPAEESLHLAELLALQEAAEDDSDEEPGPHFGQLQPFFQPCFPQWQKTLGPPEVAFREGVYVFKVSVTKRCWRRIALSADATLDDLVGVILDSIDFDSDHLYEFSYRDRTGRTVQVLSPEAEEGDSADEVQLGALPLEVGDTMKLVYDFGDNWQFTVQLERIDPSGAEGELPRILEEHGRAPVQYPELD
jgi:hypothetical protein